MIKCHLCDDVFDRGHALDEHVDAAHVFDERAMVLEGRCACQHCVWHRDAVVTCQDCRALARLSQLSLWALAREDDEP